MVVSHIYFTIFIAIMKIYLPLAVLRNDVFSAFSCGSVSVGVGLRELASWWPRLVFV